MSKIRRELRQLSPAKRLLGLLPVLVVAFAMVAALSGVGVAGAAEPEAPAQEASAQTETATEAEPATNETDATSTEPEQSANVPATEQAAEPTSAESAPAEPTAEPVADPAPATEPEADPAEPMEDPEPASEETDPIAAFAAGTEGIMPIAVSANGNGGTSESVDLGAPAVNKTVTPNADGTYTISLSVTGKSQSQTTHPKVHVIFVVDTSGSMAASGEQDAGYEQNPTGRFGLVDGKYVQLYRKLTIWVPFFGDFTLGYWEAPSNWTGGVYVRTSSGKYTAYTGERYEAKQGQTRMDAAKTAVSGAAETVLEQNDPNANNVSVQLISFADKATVYSSTSTLSDFKKQVNGMSADGGTNWEDGLSAAERQVPQDEETSTYVVFVSDGEPTFRNTSGGHDDHDYYEKYRVYGTGNSDPNGWNFDAANTVADRLDKSGVKIYSINAYGEAANLQKLAGVKDKTPTHYFTASSKQELQNAFSQIAAAITNNYTYKNVSMTDTLSSAVEGTSTKAPGKIDTDTFTYSVTDADGNTLSDPNLQTNATIDDAGTTVRWTPVAQGASLVDGYTYTVSFKCQLTQEAYDNAAALANGRESTDTNVKKADDGSIIANTNTDTGNQVGYEKFMDTTSQGTGSVEFPKPTVAVPVSKLTITKKWEGTSQPAKSDVTVTIGDDTHGASTGVTFLPEGNMVTLTEAENWTKTINVAAGPVGHTYTIDELNAPAGWRKKSVDNREQLFNGATAITDHTTTITNEPIPVSLTVTKVLKGAGADTTKPFKITVTKGSGDNAVSESHDFVNGGTWTPKMSLAYGDKVTVTEDTYDGYTQSYTTKVGDGEESASTKSTSTGEITLTGDTTVTFTNDKPLVPITGITSGSHGTTTLLGILAAAGVAIAGGFALVQSRTAEATAGEHVGKRNWHLGRRSEPRHGRR